MKQIVSCIHQYCGNGTIWHTTGSGKTLTSFNASTLLKDNPDAKRGFRDRRKQTRFIDARATNGLAATLNPFSCN